jgi:hypothetical protein
MFDDQPKTGGPKVPEPSKPAAAPVSDIVIHTMPKEFYGREALLKTKEKEVPPVPKPTPVPPPVPVPVPKPLPPVATITKPKRGKTLLIVGLSLLLGLGALGTAAYIYWSRPEPVAMPQPEPEPTPEPEPEPTPEPVKPVSGADTDSDGLTNVEELLYGTDFRNPDTDGDTFLDGNEVFHRYDPLGLAPSTLLDTGSVRVIESLELPFTIFYPTTWNPVSTPSAKRVVFRAPSGATVSVLWQEKTPETSLDTWYQDNVNDPPLSRLEATTTKEGYAAYSGPDDRVLYLDGGNLVATLLYDLGNSTTIEFLQTFKMMANSFKLVTPTPAP